MSLALLPTSRHSEEGTLVSCGGKLPSHRLGVLLIKAHDTADRSQVPN